MAKDSLQEAEAAQAEHNDDKHKAHIARLTMANKRTGDNAPKRKGWLERGVSDSAEQLVQATSATSAKKAAHEKLVKAAAAAIAKVVAADGAVESSEGDAQASPPCSPWP
jgi:hypothetical protein